MSLAGWSDADIMTVTRHASSKSLAVYQDNANNVAQTCWGKVAPYIPISKHIATSPEQWFPQLGAGVRKLQWQ